MYTWRFTTPAYRLMCSYMNTHANTTTPCEDLRLLPGWLLQVLAVEDQLCHLVELLDTAGGDLCQAAYRRHVHGLQGRGAPHHTLSHSSASIQPSIVETETLWK
jgi:hypothetical protein